MTNVREIRVGSKEQFGVAVVFEADPDNGQGATEDESASWGSMEIWVRGKNLCSHSEEGELVSSVHWYLLPVLEWLAANWDPLLHEERLPNRNVGDDAWKSLTETRFPPASYDENAQDEWWTWRQEWWRRHSLQSCRCGGLFPDVVIRRNQDTVEVSWGTRAVAGIPDDVVFTNAQGVDRFDPMLVAEPLYEMLEAATRYLRGRLPESQRLQDLAQGVQAVGRTPREDRLAWLAGLGSSRAVIGENWHKVTAAFQGASQEIAEYLLDVTDKGLVLEGSCHAALMFGSIDPVLNDNDVTVLAGKLIDLYARDAEADELKGLVGHEPATIGIQPAWEAGYALAERVIDHLGLEDQTADCVDVSAVMNRLGIHQEEINLSDSRVRGVALAGPHHRPTVLVNVSDLHNETPAGKRFTMAHELCHLLFDRTHGRKLAMASGPWAPLPVEKRANAFAAMLLMPRELVQRAVRGLSVPLESEQGVYEIRKRLGTSFRATLEHLKNLGWLDPTTVEHIAVVRDDRLSSPEC